MDIINSSFSGITNLEGSKKDFRLTLATLITSVGILATALYAFQYSSGFMLSFIPITVSLVLLSDALDGITARRLDQQTKLGELIDCFRDRFIMVAGAGNIAIEQNSSLAILIFSLISLSEAYSFLKKDRKVLNEKGEKKGSRLIRSLYILASCGVLIVALKIYWDFNFIPSLWFFMIFFMITSSIETVKRS